MNSRNLIRPQKLGAYPELIVGFSTRNDDAGEMSGRSNSGASRTANRTAEFRRRFFESLGINPHAVAIPQQVHNSTVRRATQAGEYPLCDALVTNTPGVIISVTVADCLPLFLYEPSSTVVGLVHAGWRGIVLRIVEKTVLFMVDEFSARPGAMIASIGPSAQACCYEVGDDVASRFSPEFLVKRSSGKVYLDLQKSAIHSLMKMGVSASNIESSPFCTICNPSLFHSYRRDREHAGRMIGFLGLRNH